MNPEGRHTRQAPRLAASGRLGRNLNPKRRRNSKRRLSRHRGDSTEVTPKARRTRQEYRFAAASRPDRKLNPNGSRYSKATFRGIDETRPS